MGIIQKNVPRNIYLSLIFPLIIVGVFAIFSHNILHWFIFPLLLCGFLAFEEFFRWNNKQINVFAPSSLVSIAAIPFFFINPLLHVSWDSWMQYIIPPPDWRPWLGGMAILNAGGIVVYKVSRNWFEKIFSGNRKKIIWVINEKRLQINLFFGMCVSFALQVSIFVRFGGIRGYISAFEGNAGGFSGMGVLFVFSESFPILLAISTILKLKKTSARTNEFVLFALIIGFLGLQFLFGGLRGSRGNILYSAFWIIGIIHIYLKPISNKKILGFIMAAFMFAYFYGFYKSIGSNWKSVLSEGGTRAGLNALEEESGRTFRGTILGDFGRSDVQSYLLYRTYEYPGEYRYAFGLTYIEDLGLLVPGWLWPNRPIGKTLWGTDILRGFGAWSPKPGDFASNAYGLGGEAILNFGPISVPFIYLLLGIAVARISVFAQSVKYSLLNMIFYPLLLEICVWSLLWDFGNLVYFMIQYGLFPLIIVLFSLKSRRVLVLNGNHKFVNTKKRHLIQRNSNY